MELKILTEEEAVKIIESGADRLPYRLLNVDGVRLISRWVRQTAKTEQRISAWFNEAEGVAYNSLLGETIILEMRSFDTVSGHTETLIIPPNCFDWVIGE